MAGSEVDIENVTAETHAEAVMALAEGLKADGETVRDPTTFVYTESGFLVVGPGHHGGDEDVAIAHLLTMAAANIAVALGYTFPDEDTREDLFMVLVKHGRKQAAELKARASEGKRAEA